MAATGRSDPTPPSRARRRAGRIETAVSSSLKAAELTSDMHAGAGTLAREVARTLDATSDPADVARLTPRLLEVLRELRLTPASSVQDAPDELTELLRDLATPALGD